jgi:class 3 adenylate cyclase/predicted alpha/beta hydrolase
MEIPTTRYATTTDGLAIAYQVLGAGPPEFLWVPGFASHVELFWEFAGYAHTYRRIAAFSRFAILDKRGTGLSDRSLGTGIPEDRMLDILAVLDAAGMRSATILGASEGAALAALFAASYPDRVDGLILLGGSVTGKWVPPGLIRKVREEWGSGRLMQRLWMNGAGDLDQLGRVERAMGTPRAMAEMMEHNRAYDGSAALASVRAPTLVLHCLDDPVVPLAAGRELAGGIAGATLVELPGAFHGSDVPTEMDLYVDEIEEFVTGRRRAAPVAVSRVLSTVLITDIVGSTDLVAELGDASWTALLDRHDRIARTVVARANGRWIKSTGDGILAVFDGPARAVAAADAIRDRLAPLGLRTRAGVHTGEIELRGDDVGGIAVHIAARVAAIAAEGEIWVSPTVPGLVVGSGLAFETRGRHALKGVPGEWELAALTGTDDIARDGVRSVASRS